MENISPLNLSMQALPTMQQMQMPAILGLQPIETSNLNVDALFALPEVQQLTNTHQFDELNRMIGEDLIQRFQLERQLFQYRVADDAKRTAVNCMRALMTPELMVQYNMVRQIGGKPLLSQTNVLKSVERITGTCSNFDPMSFTNSVRGVLRNAKKRLARQKRELKRRAECMDSAQTADVS